MSGGDWKDMYTATLKGDLHLVRYHVQNGVDPNYQHPEILSTPLVAAIVNGHTDIALYLLEAKADPELRSFFDDLTPIEAAQRYGNQVIFKKLIELGVSPHKTLSQRLTPYLQRIRFFRDVF